MLSIETLQNSIEEAARAVRTREAELGRAEDALAAAEHELRLLAELAELKGIELPSSLNEGKAATSEAQQGGGRASRAHASRRGGALLDAVIEILGDCGEPMQIQALMAAVKERQVRIPGQGNQANLIAVISRDPRIVRPQRGYYGLAEWGVEDKRPTTRPKRRRRQSGARK